MSAIVFHHGDYQETIYTAAVSHFSAFPRDLLLQLYFLWTSSVESYVVCPRDLIVHFQFKDGSMIDIEFLDEKSMDECLMFISKNLRIGCGIHEVTIKEIRL